MEGLHRRRWPSIVCCGVFLVAGMTAVRLHSQGPGSTEIILAGEPTGVTKDQLRQVSFDCKPLDLSADLARVCRVARHLEGQRFFEEETFGGNGRTCATCHSPETGTFSPADAQARPWRRSSISTSFSSRTTRSA